MDGFFAPPPDPWREQAKPASPPASAGRSRGAPPGIAVTELLLARSEHATIHIEYLDGHPDGFELEIRANTGIAYQELARDGDESGPDVFGRHWPMVGERRDVLPPQLLRIGVQFADGRSATNIGGHDSPVAGPSLWPLQGGGGSRGGASRFHQGYWISPLPPEGPLVVVCEWPAAEIPVSHVELDARVIVAAARQSK